MRILVHKACEAVMLKAAGCRKTLQKTALLSAACGVLFCRPLDAVEHGLSGSIRLAGSTSMGKFTEALAERFMEKYPHVSVSVEYIGSSAGIEAVLSGAADIGNSSRRLKEEEKARGAVEIPVAVDGIAVCVDAGNGVRAITRWQLADIYTGKIRDWSQIGGGSGPIVVVGQEAGSGTREAFEELLGIGNLCAYANELGSAGAVKARVSATPGAIGYVSLDVLDESVIPLALDGVEPNLKNIREGKYPLCRPFLMIAKGQFGQQNALLAAWYDYVLGEEGREIAERAGVSAVR